MSVNYQVDIKQQEPSRIPPYVNLSGSYKIKSRPGIRKHLAWLKTFCVAHGAVASITMEKK